MTIKPMPSGMDILKKELGRREAGARSHRRRFESSRGSRQTINRHRRMAEQFEWGAAALMSDIAALDDR